MRGGEFNGMNSVGQSNGVESRSTYCLSENRRGLAHFAMPCEQNVPVPLSVDGSRIGSHCGLAKLKPELA